ncbi:patatin-like phospholipase family protein [Magnetospirillum sp. 15-1]|uniref:patatin-like phospholipase family protein n=1 Tax=Magnetospirillum sp. 15-1 TaxID=1979370 RepID=UPI000BBB92E4|nr:patatin-like phospholipase family protein [Magnetospirillum sp. 15-1]
METTRDTFEVGITMAGAISAGAYSAGVLDFLIQTLDEWERHRGEPGIPNHRVRVRVMSGASAGAITAALAVTELAGRAPPPPLGTPITVPVLPGLYTAWVTRPAMLATGGGLDFLSTTDLAGKPVTSLLNADLLDAIRDEAIAKAGKGTYKPPYLYDPFHIYFTTTNLRGIPYAIQFTTPGPNGPQTAKYGMQSHGDRWHYRIENLGGTRVGRQWADSDAPRDLDAANLRTDPAYPEWRDMTEAALASGAFPIGLRARKLDGCVGDYDRRKWPQVDASIEPDWPDSWKGPAGKVPPGRPQPTPNVDGGCIDNEPFAYAHKALVPAGRDRNEQDRDKADRAVIMIDPFPEPPEFKLSDDVDIGLISVVKALFPALIDQARFKIDDLAQAADENIFSRFLIQPRRTPPGATEPCTYGIACGLLGGFGGFLHQKFREHDFQLGRRNCQAFLRDCFALPADNKVIRGWAQDPAFPKLDFQAAADPGPSPVLFYQIIPLIGDAIPPIALGDWYRIQPKELNEVLKRIDARASVLVPKLIAEQIGNWSTRTGARLLWKLFGKGALMNYVAKAIKSDLVRRDQMDGWTLTCDDERKVAAALLNPAYDQRTAAGIPDKTNGIAGETGLDSGVVQAILDQFAASAGPEKVVVTGHPAKDTASYALETEYRRGTRGIPIVGGLLGAGQDMINPPTIN